jgi:hypothetical protein
MFSSFLKAFCWELIFRRQRRCLAITFLVLAMIFTFGLVDDNVWLLKTRSAAATDDRFGLSSIQGRNLPIFKNYSLLGFLSRFLTE